MDKVECVSCGNEIIFDYNFLCKCLADIHNNIVTNTKRDEMTTLEYFDFTVKCCDEPDYTHMGL